MRVNYYSKKTFKGIESPDSWQYPDLSRVNSFRHEEVNKFWRLVNFVGMKYRVNLILMPEWKVALSGSTLGTATVETDKSSYQCYRITMYLGSFEGFYSRWTTDGMRKEFEMTLRHELAHCMAHRRVGFMDHGEEWKKMCKLIRCNHHLREQYK